MAKKVAILAVNVGKTSVRLEASERMVLLAYFMFLVGVLAFGAALL